MALLAAFGMSGNAPNGSPGLLSVEFAGDAVAIKIGVEVLLSG
jgi:hypothetical protein